MTTFTASAHLLARITASPSRRSIASTTRHLFTTRSPSINSTHNISSIAQQRSPLLHLSKGAQAWRPRSSNITRRLPLTFFHSTSRTCSQTDEKKTTHTTKKPDTRPCWKCSNPVPYLALICPNPDCKVVQTLAPGANYFEVLGLSPEPTFNIDVKDLRNKFFKIQQKVHPDSYSQNINGDQIYAQQQSSLANKAYATLKEPLSRANYILELFQSPIHESESLDNPELLMEVMEARELLEDAQTEEEVQDLKDVNDQRIEETVKGLHVAFERMDLEEAKTLAIQLQYWIRIQNVIRDWAAGKPVVADHV
ncbi:hypothetical protein BGZ94_003690 [Podila epigama]|nr:hypothetical protein BGZ94_003690 [Podila epigama]